MKQSNFTSNHFKRKLYLLARASSSIARENSDVTNCVQMSHSGKQWSTHKYSIHDANPSLSHKCVHHSYKQKERERERVKNLKLKGINKIRWKVWTQAKWPGFLTSLRWSDYEYYLLPPGWDASPSQGFPLLHYFIRLPWQFTNTHINSWGGGGGGEALWE